MGSHLGQSWGWDKGRCRADARGRDNSAGGTSGGELL